MRVTLAIVAAGALSASVAHAQALADHAEVGVDLGAIDTITLYEHGATQQFSGYASAHGKLRFFRWLVLDGWVLAAPALTPGQALSSYTVAPRIGLEFEHWGLVGGPAFNLAAGTPSTSQLLPSITAWVGFGGWRGVLGILDRPELLSLARIGVEYRGFGIAYLALYGVELSGRFWVADQLALDARVSANYLLYVATTATVGVTWVPGGRP